MVMLEISTFLHFVGLALGVGGATAANIISVKAEKDREIGKAYGKIMPSIVKMIWFGILLLIISGIMLSFYLEANKQLLIIKHILVVWIIIFGVIIGVNSHKMMINAPLAREKPSEMFLRLKGLVKSLSMINLILWYLIVLISVFV